MKKPWDNGVLRVSENHKYLVNGNTAFFWLGDTAWTLFNRLSLDEAYVYLKDRQIKGFNVIQAALVHAEPEGQKTSYQNVENEDVMKVIHPDNEQYWRHVDAIIDIASDLGIYIGVLPCWGKVVKKGFINEGNVSAYAKFIAGRYGKKSNIIWILGGDIRGNENMTVWNMMGETLKAETSEKLIGYHPFGRTSSSYWFNNCDWLDFNMFQSGHRRHDQKHLTPTGDLLDNSISGEPWYGEDNWKYVLADHNKNPLKPTLDGEPSYEHIPQGLHDFTQPYWQDNHVRRYAYWSVLTGSFGHTYGHNSIFQYWGTGYRPGFGVKKTWIEALSAEGAGQMQFLKALMTEIDFTSGNPMNEIIAEDDKNNEKDNKVIAFGNNKSIVVYDYSGREFTIKAADNNNNYDAFWFNPENGVKTYIGRRRINEPVLFTPPAKSFGHNDWVLLLENIGSSL